MHFIFNFRDETRQAGFPSVFYLHSFWNRTSDEKTNMFRKLPPVNLQNCREDSRKL